MMNAKQIFKPLAHTTMLSIALLLLRFLVGYAFIMHGWGKIQHPFNWMPPGSPVPGVLQGLAALSEFGGGIALVLGFLIPLASAGIVCTMIVATLVVAFMMGAPFISNSGGLSFELSTVYLFVAIMLLFAGPGKFSLDALIFGQRPNVG